MTDCEHQWGDPEKVWEFDADGVKHLVTDMIVRQCTLCDKFDIQWLEKGEDDG